MVPITKDLKISEQESLVVYSPAGDYADTDLILCADAANPSVPTAMLQAQFVKYGPVVYQFSTPEDLGAALVTLDPTSTHDAAALYREDQARKVAREAGTLEPGNPAAIEDAPKTEKVEQPEEPTNVIEELPELDPAPQSGDLNDPSAMPPDTGAVTEEPYLPPVDPALLVPTPEPVLPDPVIVPDPVIPVEAVDLATTTPE